MAKPNTQGVDNSTSPLNEEALAALAKAANEGNTEGLDLPEGEAIPLAKDPASTGKREQAVKKLLRGRLNFPERKSEAKLADEAMEKTDGENTVMLIHPHLKIEVPVKESLKDQALDQGFKIPD